MASLTISRSEYARHRRHETPVDLQITPAIALCAQLIEQALRIGAQETHSQQNEIGFDREFAARLLDDLAVCESSPCTMRSSDMSVHAFESFREDAELT